MGTFGSVAFSTMKKSSGKSPDVASSHCPPMMGAGDTFGNGPAAKLIFPMGV